MWSRGPINLFISQFSCVQPLSASKIIRSKRTWGRINNMMFLLPDQFFTALCLSSPPFEKSNRVCDVICLIMLHKGEIIDIYRSQSSEVSNCCRKIIIYWIGWNGNVVSVEDCQQEQILFVVPLKSACVQAHRNKFMMIWYLMVMRVSSVIFNIKNSCIHKS